ncbi:PREDICTED: lymphocyte function-associated antigen 3 isoform X2 [Calidris pugnax]|uniref:lymphocyte function-associated antigen 3 isoform X2 n=1 Tax=Calidris pugnax TaxID=198806 RepID=UPI00071D267B|nr:PREDICTED: lymphocyte function-associated antigen 3 isoform X2 [Calidris pugnax]
MRLPARLLLAASLLLAHVHCENVFGIVGENFTFPVKIDQKPVEILWTKNKNKVAEWEGQPNPTYFPSFYNRGLLNKDNGRLTIFNLENNDAGTYVLRYMDSVNKDWNLEFILAVLAPPSEPEISCNISGDDLVLKCTANFQKPLKYTWKFSSLPGTPQTQEVSVPKNVDASEKATCFIEFSQTEKSSEISLTECFPDEKGDLYEKRSRGVLIAFVVLIPVVAIGGVLYSRGRRNSATANAAQRNSPVPGSEEHEPLYSVNSQEEPNSERANSSQVADSEKENPGAGRRNSATANAAQRNSPVPGSEEHEPLRSGDCHEHPNSERDTSEEQSSSLQDKHGDDSGVNEADTSEEQSSSLQDKHGDEHGVNEGVTQGAEDGSKKEPGDSPSCSEEGC